MITRVRLKGWKSHLDSELFFSKGVNAIVGIMGSGKSSVMDAISFALFGTFPSLQGRKVLLEDMLMKVPQEKSEASVEIEFLANGKSYSLKRMIKRGKGSTAELREGDELREVSSRGVTKEVERILGMDYDLFSKAVYSEQNGLDYFIKIPTGQRRQHLDRMLRLDRFELARSEAVSLQGKVKVRKDEKLRLVTGLEKEGLEENVSSLEEGIKQMRERSAALEKERSGATGQVKGLSKEVSGFEEADEKLQKTMRLLEGLKGGLQEIVNREGSNRKIIQGKDLGRIDEEKARIEKLVASSREKLDLLKHAMHEHETRKKVAEESLRQVGSIRGICPLCECEVSGDRKANLISDREKEISSLEEDVSKGSKAIHEHAEYIVSLEKELENVTVERERVSRAFREIKELEQKLKEIMDVKGKYELEIYSLKKELHERDIKSLRDELQEAVANESRLAAEIAGLEERVKDKESALKVLTERLALLQSHREGLSRMENMLNSLESFSQALKLTQEELRSAFLSSVNNIMAVIWSEIYPYDDFSSVRLGVVDGDYVLQLFSGDWVDADSVSGGERSLAALALRIGFSLAFLPNLKWLILDEPTHNLDSNAISSFAEVLQEKLHQLVEQVFLITHDHSLSGGLGNVHCLERNKRMGEATVVKS